MQAGWAQVIGNTRVLPKLRMPIIASDVQMIPAYVFAHHEE
ncbi:MAG TPA: hypothetical protein VFA89_05230 [Terriglobales bacterium]|nr:hypothetical protein [Terriglobales bacterium]